MIKKVGVAIVALMLMVHACAAETVATCVFEGSITGTITFTENYEDINGPAISITGSLTTTDEQIVGVHGFHIHEYGDISSQTSAGSHYNPYNLPHNCDVTSLQRHVGDMGNITFAAVEGTGIIAEVDKVIYGIPMERRESVVGRAVVIHQNPDNCSQPTGAAGSRLAQCVIQTTPTSNAGYSNENIFLPAPDAGCFIPNSAGFSGKILFHQDDWISLTVSISQLTYPEAAFPMNVSLLGQDITFINASDITSTFLSIRKDTNNVVGAPLTVTSNATSIQCVVGLQAPAVVVTTTGSATGTESTTDAMTTGSITGAATTESVTDAITTGSITGATTEGVSTTGKATSGSYYSSTGNSSSSNTSDDGGGLVLGIVAACFVLIGLAWYTYKERRG